MTSKFQRSIVWVGNATRETVISLSAMLFVELGWYRESSLFVPIRDGGTFLV
ncbi:hypothetical protein [Liquorilactobacillus uvarum]|uniref:hypothetical protein n=1 Tax=Liquorilactobacillus uvarum TaxID=303240 RepID=UPI00138F60EA|nr:hypothetical protein [Liquorilactobacillus uvarum]